MKRTKKILQLVTGKVNSEEKNLLLSELEADNDLKTEFNELKNSWALLSSAKEMPQNEVNELYDRFKDRLPSKSSSLKLFYYHYSKYVAILILGMILSLIAINVFRIDVGGLFSQGLKTTIMADKEQISKVILPDSTVVWINSGSKIIYDSKFSVKNRKIILVGQAFFHAAKNKDIPLIVNTDKLEVKVLGTKFDVCAYPGDESIRVILESGKVQLKYKNDQKFSYELSPGEMATYYPDDNKILTRKVETQWYSSWKNGMLAFKEEPMAVVISELQKRYNIEIEVKDPTIYQSVFSAKINNEPLDVVLKSIEFSCSIKSTIVRDSSNPNSKLKVILSKNE